MKHQDNTDSSLDIVFYVGADPINMIRSVLDSGHYKLLSLDPSFIMALNKEYNLSLRIADFKKKYDNADDISTIATLSYLITSKSTSDEDVLRMLEKIDTSKKAIHQTLFTLPATCSDSCYGYMINSCHYRLPLVEFGFFNAFKGEYKASKKLQWKELGAFFFSIITLFFPVFKSVSGLASLLKKWRFNKQIDEIVRSQGMIGEENSSLTLNDIFKSLSTLKASATDMYGDGILLLSHYTPLMERINMHLAKLPGEKASEVKIKILGRDESPIIRG